MIPLVFFDGLNAPGICQLRTRLSRCILQGKTDLIQYIIISHEDTTLDGMFQFADIPRPVIIDDLFENILADSCISFCPLF